MKRKQFLHSYAVELKVPFYDLDPMFIVWHGNYLKYFERAREGLLNDMGFGYLKMSQSGFAYPIVDCRLKFIKPAVFEKDIIATAFLMEYEHRLRICYEIKEKDSGDRLTEGYTIQVAVDQETQEMCFISPSILVDRIRSFLND